MSESPVPASPAPVRLRAEFEDVLRHRFGSVFRIVLAIPWLVVGTITGTLLLLASVLAWLGILASGRYPGFLHRFNSAVLRQTTRMTGFIYLLTDRPPPLHGGPAPDYPVDLSIDPPPAQYDRAAVALWPLVSLPAIGGALRHMFHVGDALPRAIGQIVRTGHLEAGTHSRLAELVAMSAWTSAYLLLLTDRQPVFPDGRATNPA